MKLIKQNDSLRCDSAIANHVMQAFGHLVPSSSDQMVGRSQDPFLNWESLFPAKRKQDLRICVVLSDCQNYWELAAVRSMMASLHDGYGETYNIRYTILSAQSSHDYLQDAILDFLSVHADEYDACLALSPWVCTVIKDEVAYGVPFIFGGISQPDRVGLVENVGYGTSRVSGVVMNVGSYRSQVETIKNLKPSLKYLVVPYDSSLTHGGLTERYYGPTQAFCRAWRDIGGMVRVVEVPKQGDIGSVVAHAAGKDSLVNLSMQSSVLAQSKQIVGACVNKGIPLYAHSRQGVRIGAVLGSGNSGTDYGPAIAYCIVKTVIQGYDPLGLPLGSVDESSDLCYFEKQLSRQGFGHLSHEVLGMMRMLPIEHVE